MVPSGIEPLIPALLARCLNQLGQGTIRYRICDIVTECYDLYFGSCDHIGMQRWLRCSFHVIMFVGPLGDALSFGILCSVYKAGCCRSSGLGKKQVSLRHREPRPHNRISVTIYSYVRLMVCDMFPTPQPPRIGNLWALFTKLLCYSRPA